jgi:hypothetical protein
MLGLHRCRSKTEGHLCKHILCTFYRRRKSAADAGHSETAAERILIETQAGSLRRESRTTKGPGSFAYSAIPTSFVAALPVSEGCQSRLPPRLSFVSGNRNGIKPARNIPVLPFPPPPSPSPLVSAALEGRPPRLPPRAASLRAAGPSTPPAGHAWRGTARPRLRRRPWRRPRLRQCTWQLREQRDFRIFLPLLEAECVGSKSWCSIV